MNSKRTLVTLLTAVMVSGTSGLAAAAENAEPAAPRSSMPGMAQIPMGHGMTNADGPMNNGRMMASCIRASR